MASTLFILFMTFERFYSIIRPHKAASFNTMKRAKITILCIMLFSYAYNFPHFILTKQVGNQCVLYGSAMKYTFGQFYYWFSTILSFFLPFVLLLIMNSFIIHTLRKRSRSNLTRSDTQSQTQGQGQSQKGQGHSSKIKNSEYQIFTILLFVTFAFLILNTPPYVQFLYAMLYDYEHSAKAFAGFFLFYNFVRQTYYTNCGINFYLYVISGQKFRTDLVRLFTCNRYIRNSSEASNSDS